jgi:hypothetical protein
MSQPYCKSILQSWSFCRPVDFYKDSSSSPETCSSPFSSPHTHSDLHKAHTITLSQIKVLHPLYHHLLHNRSTLDNKIMASSGLISNASGTGVLGHIFVNGRRVQRSDLPATHSAYAAPRAAVTNLPTLNRGDEEGLAAAMLMTAHQTPSEIHSLRPLKKICRQYGTNPRAHQYVKANIWEHSTMVASVDLRDREDLPRCIDGDALLSGAFFKDAEVAFNTR